MQKRVFKASFIIVSSSIIYENAYMVIESDRIIEISENYKEEYKEFENFDYSGHLIMPGLIDTHTHSFQVGNRGKNVEKDLLDWLNTHILPWESNLSANRANISARLAYSEMIKSGTTCFNNMYFFEPIYITI